MSMKLTAEQVLDAIFNGSSYASFDGAQYYANGISMQAIADQLNATIGGECNNWGKDGSFVCGACGRTYIPTQIVPQDSEQVGCEWNYCPNCGFKIRKEV